MKRVNNYNIVKCILNCRKASFSIEPTVRQRPRPKSDRQEIEGRPNVSTNVRLTRTPNCRFP